MCMSGRKDKRKESRTPRGQGRTDEVREAVLAPGRDKRRARAGDPREKAAQAAEMACRSCGARGWESEE